MHIFEVLSPGMANPKYSVLVYPSLFNQFRIQLTRSDRPDQGAPEGHGEIVREFCTYRRATFERAVLELSQAPDPEALACTWERPYNCEMPGGRIRLDNTPADRPETAILSPDTKLDYASGEPAQWEDKSVK